MTQYPHDEFDDVPERLEREGTHREFVRVKNPRVGLWVLVIIGVAVLVFGLIMYTVLRPADVNKDDDASDAPSTSAPASSAPASATPSESAGKSATPTSPAATESTKASKSTSPTPSSSDASSSPASEVDHSVSVGVYNSTGQTGLAAQKATALRQAGFTSVSNSNWTRQNDSSAVYYKGAEQEATAKDVAKTLGISNVVQTSNIATPIAVVIGN
jgi:cytoskeletal protein RodZ